MFGVAIFEAIEVKGRSMLNFEVTTSKICNHFSKFGCQPRRPLYDKWFQTSDLFVFLLFLKDLLL